MSSIYKLFSEQQLVVLESKLQAWTQLDRKRVQQTARNAWWSPLECLRFSICKKLKSERGVLASNRWFLWPSGDAATLISDKKTDCLEKLKVWAQTDPWEKHKENSVVWSRVHVSTWQKLQNRAETSRLQRSIHRPFKVLRLSDASASSAAQSEWWNKVDKHWNKGDKSENREDPDRSVTETVLA
jgi:hypothetical protein